ncbi:alpha/beta hydrolase [Paenibacillus sp. MMS20-IR301]|uniref:alpha/beta fold hydrolase n=1 Tax=Paenibacillus sp. MMS20-IR301 TaxID=2895946 RepID=UPI0028F0D081|nr:alpha/beta hydrolase [Paenibacillus sp. MMS20-IR301]WNS45326.1 alpha/beta hydrolase [Paenibacillus sp. MMS20-IR301]
MPYVNCNDLQIYYEKLGTGDPVIFLHSSYSRGILAFSSQLLDFQHTYTCYFPDFRGHGRTRCASLRWSTPQLAADIIDFMDQMEIGRAHIVGYSTGANVGLYLAVQNPERVATLTVIGTGGFCNPAGAEAYEPDRLEQAGEHAFIGQMLERHAEAHQGNWQEFMRQSAGDWRSYPDLTAAQLSGIGCPVFIIAGEHDTYATTDRVIVLASLLRGAEVLVVPGAGHGPHMGREQPVLVNDAILDFLKANSALVQGGMYR